MYCTQRKGCESFALQFKEFENVAELSAHKRYLRCHRRRD